MKRLLINLLLIGMTISPALAEVEGTQKGALAAIAKHQKHDRRIVYDSWKNLEAEINEKAYCYEGMMLADNVGDFMKNEPIYIIKHSATRVGPTVKVHEEVIYPVWSETNGAHVLRGVEFHRVVPFIAPNKFVGLDGRKHQL